CLTDGAASHPGSRSFAGQDLAALRRRELVEAVEQLGGRGSDVSWIGAPDGRLAADDQIVGHVVDLAKANGAELVLAPSPLDPHCDHVAGAEIGRKVVLSSPGLRLAFYPVWSRWHGGGVARPPSGTRAVRLPRATFREQKLAAIAAHRSQQGQVVDDDPEGFEMPPGFARFFGESDEIYFLLSHGDWE
ncbi:MAG: PIG-L family deacetylase, partial [Acetobacteraceae bacterium]